MLQNVHEILGAIVGFIYLHVKYPNKEARVDVLDNDYNNMYSNAGSIILLNSVYVILGILLGIFVLFMIGKAIISAIHIIA